MSHVMMHSCITVYRKSPANHSNAMEKEKKANNDQHAHASLSSNIEELQNFQLIWLNKTFFYTDQSLSAKIRFRQITPYLKTFFDIDECFDYIVNNEVDYIILIISLDSFADVGILTKASSLTQITFLYVMLSSSVLESDVALNKCRAVLSNEQDLLKNLTDDVWFCAQSMTKFNIFTSPTEGGQTSKDLTKQSVKFMWFQYMLEIILNVPEPEKAKQELIDFSRIFYANN